jgi:iron(III) transport system substrate-binding protein
MAWFRLAALSGCLLGAGVVLAALGGAAAAADQAWDQIVEKAKKEGVVVVHGAPGKNYEAALTAGFQKTYPEIKVRFSGASNAVEIPKVMRERQAGIYDWDVWSSGASSVMLTLKPAGFFQPLKPILRPGIMDDSKWVGGFAAGWMDNEQMLFYAFDGTVQNPVMINADFIEPDSIKTIADLLKPEFAGKIVWHDPRVNGTGNGTSQTLYRNIGEEKLVQLYKSKIVYSSNGHQIAEWVVRGRYPIVIGLDENSLGEFLAQGLGKNIQPVSDDVLPIQQISMGFGGVGFVDRAPHPNAAIVYINWLLSKEGQEGWTRVPRNSRHTDVNAPMPQLAPKQGRQYFNGQAEKYSEERGRLLKVAQTAIDGN